MLSTKINKLGNEMIVERDGKEVLIILELSVENESMYVVFHPFDSCCEIQDNTDNNESFEDGWTHKLVEKE